MIPLLPVVMVLLTGTAIAVQSRRAKKGEMTPERTQIFETAINDVEDPARLRALATVFRAQGLDKQADLLEKRASLRELPPDVKAARRDAFRQGMASKDPRAVLGLAEAFASQGAIGAADNLRKYAIKLSDSQQANRAV